MTPVTKQQWTDALRSGEYQQCRGALAKETETGRVNYCCLGVLATIAGAKLERDVVTGGKDLSFKFDDGLYDGGVIPVQFRSTIVSDLDLGQTVTVTNPPRLDDEDGEDLTVTSDLMRALSTKNDRGASFEDIAAYLENL